MAMKSLPNAKALYTYVIINDNIIMMWALRNWFILTHVYLLCPLLPAPPPANKAACLSFCGKLSLVP